MADIHAVIGRHKAALLALPGVTAVAMGKKAVAGHATDLDSIVVFVKAKGQCAPSHLLPAELEGFPTDVVERDFDFRHTATDPFSRFSPMIGGVSVSAIEDPQSYGSIGCFIACDGAVPQVPIGNYLLTNYHVVQLAAAIGADRRIIQPGNVANVPPNSVAGNYVFGQRDATHDCAVVSIGARGFRNEVPNHPLRFGNRTLAGTGAAQLNDRVYKYGATTKHTIGIVTNLNFNSPIFTNAMYIQGENNGLWSAPGDSGSVAIRYSDDFVIGLNFVADTQVPVGPGYGAGLAYDITTQMQVFAQLGRLA